MLGHFLNTLIREESEIIDENFCFGFKKSFERKCSRLHVAASPKWNKILIYGIQNSSIMKLPKLNSYYLAKPTD